MAQKLHPNSSSAISASLRPAFSSSLCKNIYQFLPIRQIPSPFYPELNHRSNSLKLSPFGKLSVKCSEKPVNKVYKTCKICKTQYDTAQNHPRACRYHTAHFGGETKRKFESVYSGGTMNTPNSGQVLEYWHCCGSEDPFDPGCTSAPHSSYDD